MCDLPENLQIIKREHSPSTTEDKSPNNIKAKLNLHVKRRLQDCNQPAEEHIASHSKIQGIVDTTQEKQKITETTRQKRPYHKRAEKNKNSSIQSTENVSSTAPVAAAVLPTPHRKYKHKIKQVVKPENREILTASSVEQESAGAANSSTTTIGAVSAGDDDEGGHDNELKAGREKEKCPDVLAMVLSMKKRALMQDPEVQKFLQDVIEVIKS